MIPNIVRGTRVGGLLRYLYGRGRREEHVNPHLIAAWDGAGPLDKLEPTMDVKGQRDFRRLVALLEQPVRNGRNPPRRSVWHCSLRTHPTDRVLSDGQWAHIAAEVMAQAGLAPHGDTRAVRWVAVRHGADHVHIVATLVRQDRRTEWARNDRWRVQAACRNLEERYGLYRVGPADRTAHKRPLRAEVHKTLRTGRREPARDRLLREVRFAAASANCVAEFAAILREAGVLVDLRRSTLDPDQVTGYSVALADCCAADGTPVRYGGGRLAADLTLPKLRARWAGANPARLRSSPEDAYEQAAIKVEAATWEIRRLAAADPYAAAAATYAVADILTVTAHHAEGDRRAVLEQAAKVFDRAAREPFGRTPSRVQQADNLRAMARLLSATGQLTNHKALAAMLRLIISLRILADAIADIRDSQRRNHQVRAARMAARLLRAAADIPTASGSASGDAGLAIPPTPSPTAPPTQHRDPGRQAAVNLEGRGR